MPISARLWFLMLIPALLNVGCFVSPEEVTHALDPDKDGLPEPDDCDSTQSTIGDEELPYDGLDNDCDETTRDDDLDLDGFPLAQDCDDLDPTQGGDEVCDDRDNDCDGLVDEDDPSLSDAGSWYADYDRDGDGDPDSMVRSCTRPAGYVDNLYDCDDGDGDVYIGAPEICGDNIDQDCDGDWGSWGEYGDGERCDPTLPCNQEATCTGYNGHSFCGCTCPDQGPIYWLVSGVCDFPTCPMAYSPMTVGGAVISCSKEMFESFEVFNAASELVFTIDCDERDMSDILLWYRDYTQGKIDRRWVAAQMSFAIAEYDYDYPVMFFSDALITNVEAPVLDLNNLTCSGVAELTFTYDHAEQE